MAQTYPHFEVILLDDASTDGSQLVLERYRNLPNVRHIILNETNDGFQSRNWQKAIQKAENNWIWIAEGDDVVDPCFLATAASKLSEDEPALFYTDAYKLNGEQGNIKSHLYSEIKDSFFNVKHWNTDYLKEGKIEVDAFHKYLCIVNNVSASIFPRPTALNVLKNFAHKRFYSDWLFFAQIMEKIPVIYHAEALTGYRSYAQSFFGKSGNGLAKRIECFEILNYFYHQSYITHKTALAKFFTEQYLGFGLWKERKWLRSLWKAFFRTNAKLARIVFLHLLFIKISRKKIRYIF